LYSFGSKLFSDEDYIVFKSFETSHPLIIDSGWVQVKQGQLLKEVKISYRGKGAETNFSEFVQVNPRNGKKTLSIYGFKSNSYIFAPLEREKSIVKDSTGTL